MCNFCMHETAIICPAIACTHSLHLPLPILGDIGWGGGKAIFQKVYIGETRVKLGFTVGIATLGGGDFQMGLENSLYEK